MSAKIKVVSYNANWPAMFEQESILIQNALGTNCLNIHHFGSTSVPGLCAKPIIDILPVVRNILEVDKAAKAMENLGYEAKGEYGIAFRRYFQKSKNVRTHNVHVYEEGDPEIDQQAPQRPPHPHAARRRSVRPPCRSCSILLSVRRPDGFSSRRSRIVWNSRRR